jgi:tRNA pseudouridine55 synthase
VTVRALTLSAAGPASLDLDVTCSAGFYVRSLARDIGEALGCGGHLSALRRRRSGPFDVASAVTLAGLEEAAARDAVSELLLPPDEGILGLSAAIIGSAASAAIANGRTWTTTCMVPRAGAKVRIYSAAGEFVGVGLATSSGDIRANKVFLRGKSGK